MVLKFTLYRHFVQTFLLFLRHYMLDGRTQCHFSADQIREIKFILQVGIEPTTNALRQLSHCVKMALTYYQDTSQLIKSY